MKRLAWLTDIHLNFIENEGFEWFISEIQRHRADACVITGDIAEAPDFDLHLLRMAERLGKPILFVLGNHDYYRSSIDEVRRRATDLNRRNPLIRYLPAYGVIAVTEATALIGHDGWGDGRAGSAEESCVALADFELIHELKELRTLPLFAKLRSLGDEAALHLRQTLPTALAHFRHVMLAIHVPPFVEACWHQGRISDRDWLPHFTCVAAGEALRAIMKRHPDRQLTVLCGHTHSPGYVEALPNLRVKTGHAEYCRPGVQEVIEVS